MMADGLRAGFCPLWREHALRHACWPLIPGFAGLPGVNFVVHLNYGVEPFLYSADWTYALALFVALNLSEMAKRRWFSPALLALVALLFVNQMWFIYVLIGVVRPFLAGN